MTVELDKNTLVSLVKGSCPNYNIFDNPLVKKSGRYTGGFHDKWDWDRVVLENLTEEKLWELYSLCKSSWK